MKAIRGVELRGHRQPANPASARFKMRFKDGADFLLTHGLFKAVGLDVQVVLGDQPKVAYGKVNAVVAEKIMKQHVQNGQPVKENIIQI